MARPRILSDEQIMEALELRKLAELGSWKRIARKLGCTRNAIYQRINILRESQQKESLLAEQSGAMMRERDIIAR